MVLGPLGYKGNLLASRFGKEIFWFALSAIILLFRGFFCF
jgi:hypothetical protein